MKNSEVSSPLQDPARFYRKVFLEFLAFEMVSFLLIFLLGAWLKLISTQPTEGRMFPVWLCVAGFFLLINFVFARVYVVGVVDWNPIWNRYGYKTCPAILSNILSFVLGILILAMESSIAFLLLNRSGHA